MVNLFKIGPSCSNFCYNFRHSFPVSGPYIPVFALNIGKYGPEKTTSLDTFHAVNTM